MNKLTQEEFSDRIAALQRARKIFIESGLTNNISVAFEAYQLIFAEREREIFLSTMIHGNKPPTVMDKYERPLCECGSAFGFRQVPKNDQGISTQLVCSNPKCDVVLDSEYTLLQWMNMLEKK